MDNHPTFWKTHAKKFYITIGTLSVAFVLGGMMVIPLFDNRQSVLSDIVDNNPTLPSLAGTFESSEILGFEYLDSGAVIHVWNTFDDYYFNNTRMEQFSNHYEEYWTKNIFKLVYDKNGVWETIFRSDTDLVSDYNVSFNCVSDSFINITVSGNISWKQYDIHLGVHYYIEPWDENLTVVPFAKNIGSKDISETLGLAWEMQNIQINNDTSNNFFYLQQNASYWNDYDLHNSSLDNSYDNLTYWYIDNHTTNHWGWKPRAIFWIRNGNESNWFNKQLYLDWNETLDYELVVKHETGQYNSPVTLFITGGTLLQGEQKSYQLQWYDADVTWGTPSSMASNNPYQARCKSIYDSSIVTVFIDEGNSYGYAGWANVTGNTVWPYDTTEILLSQDVIMGAKYYPLNQLDIASIDYNTAVVAYIDDSDDDGWARIMNIDWTPTVSANQTSPVEFEDTDTEHITMCKINDSAVLIVYDNEGLSDDLTCVIGHVSESLGDGLNYRDTLTFETPVSHPTNTYWPMYCDVALLDNRQGDEDIYQAICIFSANDEADDAYACVINITGTTATWGAITQISAWNSLSNAICVPYPDTAVGVISDGNVYPMKITGSTISVGTPADIGAVSYPVAITALNATCVVAGTEVSSYGRSYMGTVTWGSNTISLGSGEIFDYNDVGSATWLSLDMCTIGNNKTVVVYLDEDNLRFEGNAGYGPNVDNPPTFSGESPVNTSTGIALQPTVYVVVDDQNWHGGETLTCDWYTSTNGVDWTWRQTNSSVLTDTNISYDYTQASSSETKYYWRIWANDGIFNRSDTYEFTTIPGTWQNITSISGVFQNTSILPPEITLVSPLNQTGNINETVTIVSIVEPDNQDYTVTWYSNYSDGVTWEAYDIVDYTSDGYCHAVNYNFTGYDTTYWWNVSVTDENGYTNESGKFWFNTSDDTISYYCRENINQHLYGGPNAVYATVHNQANADSLQNLLGVGQQEGAGIYLIYRSPLIFNTTTIGSGYTISNAYLNLYGYSGIAHEYFEITIQYNDTFTYPSLTTVLSDYNMNHYIGNGGYINSSDFIVNQYISITLSASGRNSMMNKTGITRFILRSNEDINSSPPPNLDMNVVTFEDAGDDNKSRIPKLRITRTIAGEAWQNITSISGIFSNSSQWNNITSISGIFSNTSEWLNTTSISGIFTNITIFNNITSISGVFTNSSSWNNISSLSGLFSNSSNWINISSISGVFTNTSSWNNITSLSGIFTNETLDIWQNITSISGIFSNSSQWNNITSISGIFSNASDFYNITSISGSFSNSSSWNNISSISGIFSNSTNWINITSISGLFSNSSNWLNITSISGTFSNTTVDTWQNITSISGIFTNNTQHNNITSISGLFSNSTIYSNITSISGAFTNVSSWLNITSISGIFQNSTEAVWQNISSISGIFTNTTSYHNISSISGVFLNTSSWINVTSISGVFTNVSNWQNITSISGVFTNTTVDLTPPTIINNFTGNLTGYGGPYDLPPYEGSGKYAPDGYYTNDSRQSDDWMYINITASDDESTVTNVWLQWLNETTWNNWTYAFTNTVDDRWEINTSGIIQTHEGYNYSFNIVANSSGGTKTHVWRKPTPGSAYLRRYVQLNCTRVNVTYFPLYLVDNTPQTTEYGAVDVNKADRLHHDQGADTTITDTGYLNSTIPDDIVRDRYCSSFTGNYFEDSVATSLSLNNIYYHTWVSQGEELGSNISFEFWESRDYLKLNFDCTAPARRNWDTTNYTFNRSEIYYDNDLPAEYSDTYYLLTGTINTTNTSIKFNDNNIYELVFVVISRTYNDPTPDNHYPAVMSNRSFTSFVLLNVPSNETLNASHPDTDSDTLSDWQELYQTYTNPFLSDTDNDGINDYWENQAGSDPNNYTETFNVSEAWQNITSISGVFQNTTAHNNITSVSGIFQNTTTWFNISSISGVFLNTSNWFNITSISGSFINTSNWINITSISGIFDNTTVATWQNITSISGVFTNTSSWINITSISGVFTNGTSWNNITSISGVFSNSTTWNNITSISGIFSNTSNWQNITSISGMFTNITIDVWQNITSISGIFSNTSNWINITSISGVFSNSTIWTNITSISGIFSNTSNWINITSISGIFTNTTTDIWNNITSISGIFSNTSNWLNITSISGTFSNTSEWQNITSISGIFTNTSDYYNITSISGIFTNTTLFNNISSISGIFSNTTLWSNVTSISGVFVNDSLTWNNVTSISGIFENESIDIDTSFSVSLSDTPTLFFNSTSASNYNVNASQQSDGVYALEITNTGSDNIDVTIELNRTIGSNIHLKWNYSYNPSTYIVHVTDDDIVYLALYNGGALEQIVCLNATTGDEYWDWGDGLISSDYFITPRYYNGSIYVANSNNFNNHKLWRLNASTDTMSDSTRKMATFSFLGDKDVYSSFAISNDYLYMAEKITKTVYCFYANNLTFIWSKTLPASLWGQLAIADGILLVPCDDWNLYALGDTDELNNSIVTYNYTNWIMDGRNNSRHGETSSDYYPINKSVIWTANVTGAYDIWQGPSAYNGIVYMTGKQAPGYQGHLNLSAIYLNNGTIKWTFPIGNSDATPTYCPDDDVIFVQEYRSADDKFWCIYPNGTEKWSVSTEVHNDDPSPGQSAQYDIERNLVFTQCDGFVYGIFMNNGTIKWSYDIASSGTGGDGQAVSGCTVVDGYVYVNSVDNGTFRLDADDGSLSWRKAYNDIWDSSPMVFDGDTEYYTSNEVKTDEILIANELAEDATVSIYLWADFDGVPEYIEIDRYLNITSYPGYGFSGTNTHQDIPLTFRYYEYISTWQNLTSISGIFSNTSNWQNITSISGMFTNITIDVWQNLTSISGVFTNTTTAVWNNITSISGIFSNTSNWINTTSISGIFQNTTVATWQNITSISGIFQNTTNYQNISSISGVFLNTSSWNNITSISGIFTNVSLWSNISSISGIFTNTTTDIWNNISSISGYFSNTSSYHNISSISGIFQNTTLWSNISSISGIFTNTSNWNNITSISGIFTNITVDTWQNITSISGVFQNTTTYNNISSISGVFQNTTIWDNLSSISGLFQNTSNWNNLTSISGVFSNTTVAVWQNLTSISGTFTNTSSWYNITSISGIFTNVTVDTWQNITSISGIFTNTTTPWNNITSISGIFTNTTTPWNNITSISGIFTNTTLIWIILTNEYPSNTSVNIPLQPIIYVTLNSTTGQTMNITWYYGLTQGSETIPLGTDTLFTNSTQTELFHIANTRSTWYYWRIQVDDGTHHINDSFYFRTEGYPGGGGYVMPTGGTIGYIGIFGLVGFIIILIYLFKRKKENNDEEEYH